VKQADPHQANGITDPRSLLDMWIGESEDGGPPRRRRPPKVVMIALTFVAVCLSVILLKYAVDVLLILLVLIAIGVVLHVVGIRLAESDILSPAWFLIIVLGCALVAYTLLVPAQSSAALAKHTPKWVTSALEWSESRGWGQRVLIGPAGGADRSPSTSEAPSATPSGPGASAPRSDSGASRPAPPVTVTASARTSVAGQPITLMARLSEVADGQRSVRFYDGSTLMGTAEVKQEGRARIAYLTVANLGVGQHEIRAELAYTIGSSLDLSPPVRHTVLPRTP
jgi:hypothetical protein